MKVERHYGPENKIIHCNIPPLLPGETLDSTFQLPTPVATIAVNAFSISNFMVRYLAGNRSLKEARTVSRKRIALAASGIGKQDPEATELNRQIQRYLQAKAKFIATDTHSLDSILALNKCVAPEQKAAGKIREIQNWIGSKSIFSAKYVCPPPENVPELMENWLAFINNKQYSVDTRAIIGHSRLNTIHPFLDGNGRTARVLLDGMLEKAFGTHIPLLCYRLSPQCPPQAYVEALELLNQGDSKGLTHTFWSNAIQWGNKLQSDINKILNQAQTSMNSKIAMRQVSLDAQQLLKHLWEQPIVCQEEVPNPAAITELTALGLLEKRHLREPQNAVIFDSPIIFAAYQAIDELIFA